MDDADREALERIARADPKMTPASIHARAVLAEARRVDEAIELVADALQMLLDVSPALPGGPIDERIDRLRGLGSEAPTDAEEVPCDHVGGPKCPNCGGGHRIGGWCAGSGAPTPTEGPKCFHGVLLTDQCATCEKHETCCPGMFGRPAVAAAPTEAPADEQWSEAAEQERDRLQRRVNEVIDRMRGQANPHHVTKFWLGVLAPLERAVVPAGSPGTPEEPAEPDEAERLTDLAVSLIEKEKRRTDAAIAERDAARAALSDLRAAVITKAEQYGEQANRFMRSPITSDKHTGQRYASIASSLDIIAANARLSADTPEGEAP